MRVLMLGSDRGLFEKKSSVGDAVLRHKKYADLAGHVDIIVFAPPQIGDEIIADNLRIFSTKSRKPNHWKNAIERAKKLAHEKPYDLIVCQDIGTPAGIVLKRFLKVPLIVSVHSMFFDKKLKGYNPLQWYLSYRIQNSIDRVDGIRVNNKELEHVLKARGAIQPMLVQPTPVDIEKFIVELKERNRVATILYVGRLSAEKNVEMLIQSLLNLKADFKATIVGDGPEKKKLEDLAKRDERIIFVGAQPYENLPQFYKKADIFVLPSNSESFGKVLIEAGASQCAIVATRTAGAESIFTNEKDALLTNVGDQKALQVALESLCSDMGRQEALGKQALETARKYSFEEGCERIVQFWKEVAQLT